MVRPKLILICQTLGEFETSEDGTMTYKGGEANAVDITPETLFEDLKLNLAEMCNLDQESLTIKYFLPGNRKTLITMSNDRDLKRMYEFHDTAITAEVFVQGNPGFKSPNPPPRSRAGGLKKAAAVTPISAVPATTNSDPATPTSPSDTADPTGDEADADAADDNGSPTMDMESTPADTVKKRRRAASKKKNAKPPKKASTAAKKKQKTTALATAGRKRKTTAKRVIKLDDDDDDDDDNDNDDNDNDADYEADDAGGLHITGNDLPPDQLVALWKDGITGPGQEFKSVYEFRETLQKYAVANRFVYRLKKNDTNRASGKCVSEGCSWKLYASWDQTSKTFRIRSMNKSHTCDGESWKSAHPTKNWVVSVIKDKLLESPHHKPKELAKTILKDFGVELNYTQVWRGITDARAQLQGSYRESYKQFPWLRDNLEKANPGSVIELVLSDEKRFRRLFMSFKASIHGFENGCRPIIFLDVVTLRSKFHEVLLMATGLDGDDGLFPIAIAVADNDNNENWQWFLSQLKTAISDARAITFVFDMEKGLKDPILEIFKNAFVGYSMYHLSDNLKKNSKGPFYGDGKSSLRISLLAAAQALRPDFFKMHTEQIKRVCSQAHEWLTKIGPEFWATASFKGEPYNHITTNVADLYSQWIDEIRESPISQKIEAIRSKIAEIFTTRKTNSASWVSRLVPSKEDKLRDQRNKAHGLKVLFSSDTLFEVQGDSTHVVDADKQSCTCLLWKYTGIPCSHAVAVFNCTGRDAYKFCSSHFSANQYRSAYSESINPIPEAFKPSSDSDDSETSDVVVVLPPMVIRSAPQPKKKETNSEDKQEGQEGQEEGQESVVKKARRVVTCARCKNTGHNKATCKADL